MFTSLFVLVGIGLIGAALGILGGWIMDRQEQLAEELADDLLGEDEDPSNDYFSVPVQTMMQSCAITLFFIGVGTGFFSGVEDMTFVNALYMSVITVTTVGFGDYSPKTQAGRMFGSFWILFGVLAVSRAIGSFIDIFLEARAARREEALLKKKVSMSELVKFAGKDGKLDMNEFIILKLQDMGKITTNDVDRASLVFKDMDKDGTGTIDASDLRDPC